MNESLLNFFGSEVDITTKKGIKFSEEVLDFMRDRLMKISGRDWKYLQS